VRRRLAPTTIWTGRRPRRIALLSAFAGAAALAAAPAVADINYPELDVYTFHQAPGGVTDVDLDVELMAASPAAATVALTVPAGYRIASMPVGAQLGPAEVDVMPAAGGSVSTLKGTMVTADPASLAADPQAQLCAPGAHAGAWRLALNGSPSVAVPIAVDQLTTGGSFRLVICLGAFRTAGLKPVDVYLETRDVFTNPAAAGVYRWSALVTPFGAAGTADPTLAFELRGDEPLPETLGAKPVYDMKRKTLTITGTLLAAHKPRAGIRVHLLGGRTAKTSTMKELGVAVTASDGSYTFVHRRLATTPRFVYAHVNFYASPHCDQASIAPAGCASESTDGTDSSTAKVVVRRR
jgi:hypothetical protein